jgi:hypothetical protein
MVYPNDANGDVLRRMEAQGDDLTRDRRVTLRFTLELMKGSERRRKQVGYPPAPILKTPSAVILRVHA